LAEDKDRGREGEEAAWKEGGIKGAKTPTEPCTWSLQYLVSSHSVLLLMSV